MGPILGPGPTAQRPRGLLAQCVHGSVTTWEVVGYVLGVAALDSDGEAVAATVLTDAELNGRKDQRRHGALIARWRGPVGNGEG
jgi:hypothetical protein